MSQPQHGGTESAPASAISDQSAAAARYWSCSHEELIELQIEAWTLGGACAKSDGQRALRDLLAIEQRAEVACEESLVLYVPLDLARFHDVFTLAWVGGYCASRGPDAGYGTR